MRRWSESLDLRSSLFKIMILEKKQDLGYQLHLDFSSDNVQVFHLNQSEADFLKMPERI